MRRLGLILVLGLVLGGIVHLVTIMAIPRLAERDGWSRVMALTDEEGVTLIPTSRPGEAALPALDPAAVYAACRFDLSGGPVAIRAPMPQEFWSVSFHSSDRTVFYAVTNEAAPGDSFQIELRNAEQTRRFQSSQAVADPQTLRIEAPTTRGFALFRALAPHRSQRPGVEAALAGIECGPLTSGAPPPPPEGTPEEPPETPLSTPLPRIRPQ